MKTFRAAFFAVIAAAVLLPAGAQAAPVSADPSALNLANAIMANNLQLNPGLTETKFFEQPEFNPGTAAPTSGLFAVPFLGFPTGGDDTSTAVIATGDVTGIENGSQGPTLSDTFTDLVENHSVKANDVTTLQLSVIVPPGSNCMAFDYRFMSEEFPNFVGTSFNDAFIAGIDFNDWNNETPFTIYRPHDIAADPAGKPVSVNGVGPTAMLPSESPGTIFNAATGLVTTKSPITAGPHKVYFSIFDASDQILDSGVFIDNLRFITEGPDTCKPPLAQDLVPPAVAPPPPPNNFTIGKGSSITFGKGTTNVIVTVPAPGVLTATDGSVATTAVASSREGAAAKKKKKKKPALIKKTSVIATKAGKVKITIKPTKAGKAIIRKKGKLKAKVRFTFTPTGGLPSSQVKTITIKKKP